MKTIVNCETNEVIERPLNEKELAQEAIDNTNYQAARALMDAEAEAKTTAKAALLERLGITQDEANLLLS